MPAGEFQGLLQAAAAAPTHGQEAPPSRPVAGLDGPNFAHHRGGSYALGWTRKAEGLQLGIRLSARASARGVQLLHARRAEQLGRI
eukprot:gene46657-58172_t